MLTMISILVISRYLGMFSLDRTYRLTDACDIVISRYLGMFSLDDMEMSEEFCLQLFPVILGCSH